MNYWHECVSEAMSEAGVTATDEQIDFVTGFVEIAHENYSTAMGHDVIGNPMVNENKRLSRELEIERSKRVCPDCKGAGTTTTYGPVHSGTSQCFTCKGEGKVT